MKPDNPRISAIRPNLFLIPAERPNSHAYLIKGTFKNILIDTGLASNFPHLEASLAEVGLRPKDIQMVILTHEHLDHIGGAVYFSESAVIAAHFLAANKISIGDEFVLMNKYFNLPARPFSPELWLEGNNLLDLGNYRLQTIHTPGHCSGCLSLYEPDQRLLFTGDTLLAGGIFSGVLTSGNISDQINSLKRLQTLRAEILLPGHGPISDTPEEDIEKAIQSALDLLRDTRILFDTLNTQETFQRLFSSARNRPLPMKTPVD
jgi:glyoxylase-like metal-dependent hydrolase (beta-lactamase superfamily II)